MYQVYRDYFLLWVIFWLVLTPAVAAPAEQETKLMQQQRKEFLDAKQALQNRQIDVYNALLVKLKNYPLYGYLEYDYFSRHLDDTPNERIRQFIRDYSDSPISSQLHIAWLYTLANNQQWKTFLEEYHGGISTMLRCYALQARLTTGKVKGVLDKIQKLWLVGYSQPEECDSLFEVWQTSGRMTTELVWQRIRLAMANRKISLARYLKKYLDPIDQKWVDFWIQMHRYPARMLKHKIFQVDTSLVREIILHGINRLNRIDVEAAHEEWQIVRSQYHFSKQQIAETDREIALTAAYRHNPNALEWLTELKDNDENVALWRVRTSLAEQNWPVAYSWIEDLPGRSLKTEQWQYWRGRTLQEMGLTQPEAPFTNMAEQIFDSLAKRRNYYGFLSADQLGRPYNFEEDAIDYEEQELDELKKIPAIQRAYELFKLRMNFEGRREWQYALHKMNERQLQLAAVLANRWDWHDRAILTLAQSDHSSDLDLRFPMVYQEQVLSSAKSQQIDPAWVYGIVRQESAFMTDAQSRAGAMGLMQLLPGTARITAQLLNAPISSKYELLDADTNILLGSAYLRRMLDENYGHQILATAAYNAGPNRVKQWMPEKEIPADLWVETIPFFETRGYVRSVMAFTTIFDKRLDGTLMPLSKRMPDIPVATQ